MSPVSDSLNAWLDFTTRTSKPFPFDVSDLAEHVVPDVDLVRALGQIVLRAKTDPAVLDRMAQVVGWGDATSRLRRSRRPGVRRGDFGEALACEALEVFESFSVPVRKLRYQMDPEQTLHGTDIVAFKLNGHDRVQDLHFVECKLRTFRNLPAGVEAHQQLVDDRAGEDVPEIVELRAIQG